MTGKLLVLVGDIPVRSLSRSHLESFLESHQHLSPSSQRSYWRAIKVFCSWLTREGYVKEDPTHGIRSPRVPKQTLLLPARSDLAGLLEGARRNHCRDTAIVLLALDGNLRAGEIYSLKVDALDISLGVLRVQGKGGKTRYVPLGREAWRALYSYLDKERPTSSLPAVFLSEQGEELSREGFKQIWRRLKKRTGFQYRFHDLRHAGATDDALHGMDPFTLMEKMGHEDINTTMKYVHLARRLQSGGMAEGTADRYLRRQR